MSQTHLSFHEREQQLRCPNCKQCNWRFYIYHKVVLVSPMGIKVQNFGEFDDAHGVICDSCEAYAPDAVVALVKEGLAAEDSP